VVKRIVIMKRFLPQNWKSHRNVFFICVHSRWFAVYY